MAVFMPILVGVLELTWMFFRIDVLGDKDFREIVDSGQPVVLAIWHESLLVFCWYVSQLLKAGVKVTFLISPSVDGEIGARLLAWYGSTAVRGSARRSGAAALMGLNRTIRRDRQSPCITLDGSKGPRRYCKQGAVTVARMSGAPIVPIGVAAHRSWRMRSWDRHLVPKPFSRVVILVGEPYDIPRELDDDAAEAQRSNLEARIDFLTQTAEELADPQADAARTKTDNTEEER